MHKYTVVSRQAITKAQVKGGGIVINVGMLT